jgi:predicted RNA-binding protein with PUA domain
MSNIDEQILRFRDYKKIIIYQCVNCNIWIKEREKICPICDACLDEVSLTTAELVQKRTLSYLKYNFK